MTMVGVRWRVLAVSMLTSVPVPTIQGQSAGPNIQTECLAFGLSANGSRSDIYCMDLYGTPDLPRVSGKAWLSYLSSPFGISVAPNGSHRYRVTLEVEGLPAPSSLGEYATYVAWATTPILRPMTKLGEVRNGETTLGEVDFNKFVIFISAERSPDLPERTGRLVMRGTSPSSRLQSHDLLFTAPSAALPPPPLAPSSKQHGRDSMWPMPPGHPAIQMPPGLSNLMPDVSPFLPDGGPGPIPEAKPREFLSLADGDTLSLDARVVKRTINGRTFTMYGFNGQYPGPLLHVPEKATIVVNFTNNISLPTSVHWHGVRLDNRFDGVPFVTQDPVEPGATFEYQIFFRDPGIYWYHPHHREDIQQDLGLYGNMLVRSSDPDYFGPANREEIVMLDDILIGDQGLIPFGLERATHTFMGRFGNVFLVNGEPHYTIDVDRGEVIRFFFTNVSNTRTFNLGIEGAALKVVGSDIGKFEREEWVENVVIAPAERYIVEGHFPEAGTVTLTNQVQGVNHIFGNYFSEVDTLGTIRVSPTRVAEDHSESFGHLRHHDDVIADIGRYRPYFDKPVDREMVLRLEARNLPPAVEQLMRADSAFFNGVEWSRTMPIMNWASTPQEVSWLIEDPATGRRNMDIDWQFTLGDIVKIRITNDRHTFHAMQHPVHFHGQRFLILDLNGVPNDNLVWKDTMLMPVGAVANILLEVSNPGKWMVHCHIAEHLESGMRFVFEVRIEK